MTHQIVAFALFSILLLPQFGRSQEVRCAGISQSGDWENRYIFGHDKETFLRETQKLFEHDGLRLVDIETYVEDGKRKWAGVTRSGDWESRLIIGRDKDTFLKEIQQLFDRNGLRLVDIETYQEDGKQKWAGISRSGDWASRFIIGRDKKTFLTDVQQLFDRDGLRLIDIETYQEDGKRKWAGITRSGDWANRFIIGRDKKTFLTDVQQLFDRDGLRLIDTETYVVDGKRKWAGITRSGDWANRFIIDRDTNAFSREIQGHFDRGGLRLIDIEFYNP